MVQASRLLSDHDLAQGGDAIHDRERHDYDQDGLANVHHVKYTREVDTDCGRHASGCRRESKAGVDFSQLEGRSACERIRKKGLEAAVALVGGRLNPQR